MIRADTSVYNVGDQVREGSDCIDRIGILV
jgi:hypothetical protein